MWTFQYISIHFICPGVDYLERLLGESVERHSQELESAGKPRARTDIGTGTVYNQRAEMDMEIGLFGDVWSICPCRESPPEAKSAHTRLAEETKAREAS